MRKVLTSAIGLILFIPAFALADTTLQAQVLQLTIVLASLEAQIVGLQNNQSLACAALPSKPSVAIGEAFSLAWGSVGAVDSGASSTRAMWTKNGGAQVSLDKPGTWTYHFAFYDTNGASTTCTAKIVVK